MPHALVESGRQTPPAATPRDDTHPRRSIPTSPAPGRTPDRRRGPLPLHDDQPGAYPWRNHHNAWRPAHIHFSLFGPAVRHAAGDADVLPRRPAASRTTRCCTVRRPRARSGWCRSFDLDADRAGMGARLPVRHRRARRRQRRRSRSARDRPDGWSPRRRRPSGRSSTSAWRRRMPRSARWRGPRHARRAHPPARPRARRRRASRCPTRWSSCGRPTPAAVTRIPTDPTQPGQAFRGFGPAAAPTPTAIARSTRSGPARVAGDGAAGAAHRRVRVRARPAAAPRHAHLLRRRPGAGRATPCWRWCPRRRATLLAHAAGQARTPDDDVWVFDDPPAGRRARPCSSTCDAHEHALDRQPCDDADALAAVFSDAAVLQAMLDFEAALARAEAQAGVIPARGRSRLRAPPAATRFDARRSRATPRPATSRSRSSGAARRAWRAHRRRRRPLRALGRDQPGRRRHRAGAAASRGARRRSTREHARLARALTRLSETHAGTLMLGRTCCSPRRPSRSA